MGDFINEGDTATTEDLTEPHSRNAFSGIKNHFSAPRFNSDLAFTETIRSAHPGCNVTGVNGRSCDLIAYAEASHAKVTLRSDGDKFMKEREYSAPASRLDQSDGTLQDKVKIGSYDITWRGQTYLFYLGQWPEKYYGRMKMLYIVTSKQSATTPDDLILAACKWTSELHAEVYVFDDGDWEKNTKLWTSVQSSSWDDVILDPTMKDTLISDVQNFFDSRALYEEYAVPWKRGIIVHGTPGCGKTISINALMNTLDKRDQPVASLYVKSLKTRCDTLMYSVREIFRKAREMAPCLLVFEDLDSLVVDEVRSYFLNEVDGLEDNNGILMIGSTNHLDRLDPGISKRPSRFDRKYHYKIPGSRERVLYCEYWKKKLDKNSSIDFDPAICDVVAQLTDGFSYAYLKELFVQTLLTIVGGRQSQQDDNEEAEQVAKTAKVIEGSAKVAKGDEKVSSNEGEEGKENPEQVMPTVEIPEALKANPLMRILHKQAVALWKDMDNSKDEEAGVKKVAAEPETAMRARPFKADEDSIWVEQEEGIFQRASG